MIAKHLKTWLYEISRGYTLPMSLLPCAIAVIYAKNIGGILVYGLLAALGVMLAHLGTNVFDDFVDHITKTPKQKCKTAYLDNKFTTPKKILLFSLFYFLIAGCIGLFFIYSCGLKVLVPMILGGLICLSYPKLNNYCLGEVALVLAFGPLLFGGISFVMLNVFDEKMLLLSLPVTIFVTTLLVAHALMDFDFDIKNGKKNLCTVLGNKNKALTALFVLYLLGYALLGLIVYLKILPLFALFAFLSVPLIVILYKQLAQYISTDDEKADLFMQNFKLARNIVIFNLAVIIISL